MLLQDEKKPVIRFRTTGVDQLRLSSFLSVRQILTLYQVLSLRHLIVGVLNTVIIRTVRSVFVWSCVCRYTTGKL